MTVRSVGLHAAVLAGIWVLGMALPEYHHGQLSRILVLAIYAMGFNILFGYTGLLSLGHALFFAAGMYATGLTIQHFDLDTLLAFPLGIVAGGLAAFLVGLLALRTTGVAFMIVTLMFSQAGYLTILHFGTWTRGDEGFVLPGASRMVHGLDLTSADGRFLAAFVLFSAALMIKLWLVQSKPGRVFVGVRENEERTSLLGYNTWSHKMLAVTFSGIYSGMAGATYGLLFGYVGATFAEVIYSIFPLLWVLLGGAGTVLGPLVGTAFMVYLVDYASSLTDAYMLVVGCTLVLLILFARRGIVGVLQRRMPSWLP